jgi:glycine amidinotransferase
MLYSCNEWSPLKEVIVGNSINSNLHGLDLSFKLFFHDNIYNDLHGGDIYFGSSGFANQIKPEYIEQHEEDIAGFVETLEKESIKVLRPLPLHQLQKFKTPYWESITVPALNIRDQCLVVGNEIIESSVQVRCRYFENDLLKPIFMKYFKRGCKWTCAPRPMLLDSSFDLSYVVNQKGVKKEDYPKKTTPYDMSYEIMFDAAQCLRFDDKILMNISNMNHYLGKKWLESHLLEHHVLDVELCDNHIDSGMMPIREGTLLVNPHKVKSKNVLPQFLRSWDIVEAPEPKDSTNYNDSDLLLASIYVDINVLSLDGNKIIVNSSYTPLIKLLEKKGFTPIPVRMRHKQIFGGGFHCITLDTLRCD